MDMDDLDQFGVPWSRSWVPEMELVALFESVGLTVSEASIKRKRGTLPKGIADVWDQHDALQEKKAEQRRKPI
jgi:hypothetical protein